MKRDQKQIEIEDMVWTLQSESPDNHTNLLESDFELLTIQFGDPNSQSLPKSLDQWFPTTAPGTTSAPQAILEEI